MKKRWVALLLLSGCIAWPTTGENPQPAEDGSGGTSDGGTMTGDGPVTSACPDGGVVVRSMAELQERLADLSSRAPDNNTHVFCVVPASTPYSLSAPVTTDKPTLGNVYFAPITGRVTVVGLGQGSADTVIAGANPSGQQPTLGNPRCPAGSARFFFVDSGAHLTLSKLTLQGGCIQGARGGDSPNGGGGGGGSAGFGGAVAVKGGRLTLDQVSFRNNFAVGGLGGASLSSITTPPGGGGGGAGMDTLGRTLTPDGASPQMNTKQYGGDGGGFERGLGTMAGDAPAGAGSSGGGGGGGIEGAGSVKGGTGGAGGFWGGGGGGGGAALSSTDATSGNGGASGYCGGGGGAGVAKVGMVPRNTAGGGGRGYANFLGVTEMQAHPCGDPGNSTSGSSGGTGGSGWGVGGAIFFAGGELTIVKIDPNEQNGNLAFSPNRDMIRPGLGALLFAIGTDNMQIGLFKTNVPTIAASLPGIVHISCTMMNGCKTM